MRTITTGIEATSEKATLGVTMEMLIAEKDTSTVRASTVIDISERVTFMARVAMVTDISEKAICTVRAVMATDISEKAIWAVTVMDTAEKATFTQAATVKAFMEMHTAIIHPTTTSSSE